ncbi:hypothetical protein BLSMQ_0983 [Brevibacterium aurantiacum]|uniref:Uncharacterized protein n=1 Tax=Brevibacterium aurantiacum TaxID=273384 RepID=A0A1D7W101_BREAU|nr:hypothetical protein BLSMQ_0983 [Brevibacterium aurantiacum]
MTRRDIGKMHASIETWLLVPIMGIAPEGEFSGLRGASNWAE